MKKSEPKPNLLLAGFQKCGSSSLFHLLKKHPDIVASFPKETFALSDPDYQNYSDDAAWDTSGFCWSEFFPDSGNIEEKPYYMEGSVCNFYQDKALRFAGENPETKVIFLLRDPVDRFASTYRYYGGSGVHLKPGITLEEYYEKCREKDHEHEAMNNALEHGRYTHYINTWEETLGEDNVLVLGMRQVINDKNNTLSLIFNFLGIEIFPDLGLPHKNKSTVSRFPWFNRMIVKVLGGFGLSKSSLGTLYKNLSEKEPEKLIVSDSLKKKLQKYYENEYRVYSHYF